MKWNFLIFGILIFSVLLADNVKGNSNKILVKVNNEIITSVDILQEIKYLSIINKEFSKTEKNLSIKIAKNSLIKEKIKYIELLNNYKNIKLEEKLLEQIIVNYFSNLNINSLNDFEEYFKSKNLNTNLLRKKIEIEFLWNRLIYKKFYKNVKINEDQIKKSLLNKKKQKVFLLSEIVFKLNEGEKMEDKLKIINKTIQEKNFSQAALIYSVSGTSKNGGNLNWIKEDALNNKIKKKLAILNKGEITEPINIPGGFLLLKIEDIKEEEKNIDLEKDLKIIIEEKTNEQLNQFSIIYFNKIEKNINVNEL